LGGGEVRHGHRGLNVVMPLRVVVATLVWTRS
jgi:hypothetical protein